MKHERISKAVTGLAVGGLLTAPLLGVFALLSFLGIPTIPFTIFEWLIRVLPGRLVIFGLENTIRALQGLGFNIKDTAKTAEQVLAITLLFVAALVIGLLFFSLVRSPDRRRVRRYGLGVGALVGAFSVVIALVQNPPAGITGKVGLVIVVLGLFLLWGWGMARFHVFLFPPGVSRQVARGEPPPVEPLGTEVPKVDSSRVETAPAERPAIEVHGISRRRFLIQMGGLVATIVVLGADLGDVLRAQAVKPPQTVKAPIPFPNANSPVQPVPGTRPEYTAVVDHYRVDIDLSAPAVDGTAWRLAVDGLVATPLSLTLDQLKTQFTSQDLFVTLQCISNPVGGPLIGTTLWTGVPFRDVLRQASPMPSARYAHLVSEDGFDESVDLAMVENDQRVMLTYAWDGQPLPAGHGFPLRIYIPDLYGMKQPKWISHITLVADPVDGYWVTRGWDRTARMKTTSVVDTVAVDSAVVRGTTTYIPVGGIAHAGARGISKVEVSVDGGPWEQATLRAPLSGMTWVIWRYEWPFKAGVRRFAVRATDGQGQLQDSQESGSFPSGATGTYTKQTDVLPLP